MTMFEYVSNQLADSLQQLRAIFPFSAFHTFPNFYSVPMPSIIQFFSIHSKLYVFVLIACLRQLY